MRLPMLVVLACMIAGCGSGSQDNAEARADTISAAARDSAIAESRLPGASAVGKALDASAAAQERAARLDSIR